MRSRGLIAGAFAVFPALLSCATIISGKTQDILVSSLPPGATVTANPTGEHVITPAKLTLRRDEAPYRLSFRLDGYEPYNVTISSATNGWVYANLLLGGIVGLIVDFATGAATKLQPEEVNANLVRLGVQPPTSSSGTTVYVFADRGPLLAVLTLE